MKKYMYLEADFDPAQVEADALAKALSLLLESALSGLGNTFEPGHGPTELSSFSVLHDCMVSDPAIRLFKAVAVDLKELVGNNGLIARSQARDRLRARMASFLEIVGRLTPGTQV